MKKVYAVSHGEYSDYSVEVIFSTKAKAQAFVDEANALRSRGSYEYFIEEYSLDIPPAKLIGYYVCMTRDGKVLSCVKEVIANDKPGRHVFSDAETPGTNELFLVTSAKTEKGAIKRANEVRTQLIALGRWGVNE